MITSKNGQTADTANFVHGCFTVQVGTDYQTYQEIMQAALKDGSVDAATNKVVDTILTTPASADGTQGYLPTYFSKKKCRDSSLGGNDAINPLPQFGLDDDLSHPHFIPNYGDSKGMGRVYSENYDDTQQILYMGFGIPVYSNIGSFWSSAVDSQLADFTNKGSGISPEKIGVLIGKTPIRLAQIATIPHKWIAALTDTLQQVPITKYYAFSSQMPMYFRFVNVILVMLATNMNIMDSNTDIPTTGSQTTGATLTDLLATNTSADADLSGMPNVFKNSGLDMARIMTKRYLYENGNSNSMADRNTDEALFKASDLNKANGVAADTNNTQSTNPDANTTNSSSASGDTSADGSDPTVNVGDGSARFWSLSWVDAFKAAYTDTIYDGHLFIGFRIDKGMGASESFSNSTGESTIAQTANSKFNEGRDTSFDAMGGNFGENGFLGMLSAATGVIKGVFNGLSKAIKLDPLAAALSGAAKIDIPDVWMSSNYSRSASFSITCLSPYGDPASIFQSEYVPMACVLAGTLPRGTGQSSHSAPFICQAYCRGVFSSPLCMIESLEITRGADQFGFSASRLPLKLVMHVTLKDLTPNMYMSMAGNQGIAKAILGTDDNFGEYMLTMSGMGLRDRLAPFRSLRRKTQILLSITYKNKLSPFMLGMEGGSRFMISRVISSIKSGGRGLPGN